MDKRDISQNIDNGNNNQQAGRDAIKTSIHYDNKRTPIRFYERDIQEIIVAFSKNIEQIKASLDDFTCPGIEEKNKLNKLSKHYFELMKQDVPEFKRINSFLRDPKNKKYLDMYEATVAELNCQIIARIDDLDRFDLVFPLLVDYVVDKNNPSLIKNRRLLIVFLHFMYWNCDIGKKQ